MSDTPILTRRTVMTGALGVAAGLSLPACVVAQTTTPVTPKRTLRRLGVFPPEAGKMASVKNYETWLGRGMYAIVDNADETGDWNQMIRSLDHLAMGYRGATQLIVFGIPLLPGWPATTLKQGAAGAYDVYFQRMAALLLSYGHKNCALRIGWEANGGWMKWCAANDVTSYKAFYRRVVGIFRKANPGFIFTWDTTLGWKNARQDTMWPGPDVVDVIGLDIYDEWWNAAHKTDVARRWKEAYLEGECNLNWMRAFAKAKGKPIAISEWGLRGISPSIASGRGGGDNPYFIKQMAAWLDQQTDLRWASYFQKADSQIWSNTYPKSYTAFRAAFGKNAV